MARKSAKLSICFADISGSTRLYETLGDAIARQLVSQCLELMTEQIHRYDGTVIKTIGDEIMCTFPSADLGIEACAGMQEAITEDLPEINPNAPKTLTIRVGIHHGPVILENNDVFGDAVNVAARMAGLAKGMQIITTRQTTEMLSPGLRSSTRHLDRIAVKGKSEVIDIFEYIWQPDDVTQIVTGAAAAEAKPVKLYLTYMGRETEMNQKSGTVVLGRGNRADMVIRDTMASREHARIECRRNKFVLVDQSTNGTYVLTPDGPAYLRREEVNLTGKGKISLGRDVASATHVVEYNCKS